MPSLSLDISDPAKHASAAEALLEFAGTEKIFLFDAPMGAGKTTFIKSLCLFLGVTDAMSSPTYSIVNEYRTEDHQNVFHFDLYRLKDASELYDLGFEEYLASGAYAFVEWPALAQSFFNNFVRVAIKMENNNRYICAEKFSGHA